MPKFFLTLLSLYFFSANLIAEETSISLTGGFLPYEAYYVQSIDLATGKSDVQLFDYLISSTDDPPIEFHISFRISILSPELDINEKTTLLDIRTLLSSGSTTSLFIVICPDLPFLYLIAMVMRTSTT